MKPSPFQLFNLSTLAAVAVAVTAATASAAGRPPFDTDIVTNYYLRLSAPEAKGAQVRARIVHTMHDERPLDGWVSRIGEDGLSGWIKMPRYRKKKGFPDLWYQSCIIMLHPAQPKFDRFKWVEEPVTVGLEIADAPDGNLIASLPTERVEGGVVTALFDGTRMGEPVKASWFNDHLDFLIKALDDAGCGEIRMPRDSMMIHGTFATGSRFWERSVLTRDKRLSAKIDDLLMRLGVTINNGGSTNFMYHGFNFVTGDKEGIYRPLDEDWFGRSRAFWEAAKKRYEASGRIPEVIKIGDEIGQVGRITNSPAFRSTFESIRARLAPEVLADVAFEGSIPGDAWKNRPPEREKRLVRYLVVRARNKETAKVLKASTDDVRAILGENVKTQVNMTPWYDGEGGSWAQTLVRTPDPFLLAREGSIDYPEPQGMTPYSQPTGPMANALLAPAFVAQIRELNTRPGGRSREMLFPCRTEAAAYEHVIMSALVNADTDLSYYVLGFRGTWWEWADVPEKIIALGKCSKKIFDAEPFLRGQRRAKADIAMLLSESTDIWQCEGDWRHYKRTSAKSEMRGDYYALRFSGYRVDFVREHMIEDGFLDGYKVLWATMRNLNRVSQAKVMEWVKAGGTLILVPGAITRDEADDDTAIFDAYRAGGEAAALEGADCTEFDYKKRDTSAAPKVTDVGEGKVIAFGWMPGMEFCSGALRRRELYRDETPNGNPNHEILSGTQRYGVTWWMEGDEAVREKIAAVAAEAGATRQIALSHGNIDAGVLDDGLRAFVGFSNYNVGGVKGVVATFTLKKRYENVETLDGAPVKVEWDGTTARCTFDLGDSQALLFK